MQDFEYRAQFQGAAQAEGFQAVKAPDPTPLMEKNAQIEQNNMEAAAQARLSAMQEQEKFRQIYEDKRLQQLAAFSETLSNVAVKAAQAYNESELLAGLNEDLHNPVANAAEQAEYDQQVRQLKEEDDKFQTGIDSLEKAGARKEQTERLRFAGGWRGYGQKLRQMAEIGNKIKPYLEDAFTADNQTPIPDPLNPGQTFTPVEAVERGEEYVEAAMNVLTNLFFSENRVMDYNRGLVNNALMPAVRKAREEISQTTRTTIVKNRQEAAKQDAKNVFIANAGSANPLNTSFSDLVLTLARSGGMSKSEAVVEAIKITTEAEKAGVLTRDQTSKIFGEIHTPTGKTVEESFPIQIGLARQKIKTQEYDEENLNDKINKQEADNKAEELVAQFELEDPTKETVMEIAEAHRKEFNLAKPSPLLTYWADNQSSDVRDLKQQTKDAYAEARSGTLTTNELTKQFPMLVKSGVPQDLANLVEANDKLAQIPEQDFRTAETNLNNAVTNIVGVDMLKEGLSNMSAVKARNALSDRLRTTAGQLMLSNDPKYQGAHGWRNALADAGQVLESEIQKNEKTSLFYREGFGPDAKFVNFVDKTGATGRQIDASTTLATDIRESAVADAKLGGLGSLTDTEDPLFEVPEIKALNESGALSVNTGPGYKLNVYVRNYNRATGNPDLYITHDDALDALLNARNIDRATPRRDASKKDEYEETAKKNRLMKLIASPTSAGLNHVAVVGGHPPVTIRTGQDGVTDVMQAAVHYKMPPNLTPLAGAVFALESARGTKPSGVNNFFGIKGGGTVRTTTEYAGQVTQAEFKNYDSPLQSVNDFGKLLTEDPRYAAVVAAKTPKEAAIALQKAGYATDPEYANKLLSIYRDMGINPDVPFSNHRLIAESPYSDPSTMGASARKFITGNTGTSTGPHVHVGYQVNGAFVDPSPILNRLYVKGEPLAENFDKTSGYGSRIHPVHGTKKFHRGIDYATPTGTPITVRGAAYVESVTDSSGGGVISVYRLPGGSEILLMHGHRSNLR